MAEVALRAAVPHDRPVLESIVAAAYAPYVEQMGAKPAPMLDDYGELIDRGVVTVAEVDGVVEGLVVMWAKSDHFYIDNIAIRPGPARGSGIGAELLDYASTVAASHGCAELRLYTNEAMTQNLVYYPKRGFRETGRAVEDGYRRVYFARTVKTV